MNTTREAALKYVVVDSPRAGPGRFISPLPVNLMEPHTPLTTLLLSTIYLVVLYTHTQLCTTMQHAAVPHKAAQSATRQMSSFYDPPGVRVVPNLDGTLSLSTHDDPYPLPPFLTVRPDPPYQIFPTILTLLRTAAT